LFIFVDLFVSCNVLRFFLVFATHRKFSFFVLLFILFDLFGSCNAFSFFFVSAVHRIFLFFLYFVYFSRLQIYIFFFKFQLMYSYFVSEFVYCWYYSFSVFTFMVCIGLSVYFSVLLLESDISLYVLFCFLHTYFLHLVRVRSISHFLCPTTSLQLVDND